MGQWVDRVFKNADYDLTVMGHAEPFDIEIYGRPNYYFRYNNPKFQELMKKAEEEMNEAGPEEDLRRRPRGCWPMISSTSTSSSTRRCRR